MNNETIEKFEEEIKNLHCNPQAVKSGFSDAETKEYFKTFWDIHVKPVIEYSKQMAEKYKADTDAIWLGAILHDIAKLSEEEPHEVVGSEKAYYFLLEKGFDAQLAEKVKSAILTHACRKKLPETAEQKILATADAMACFLSPYYFWSIKYLNKDFTEIMEGNMRRMERDYNDKIFFEDEKKMVEEQYKMLKNWFKYEIDSTR